MGWRDHAACDGADPDLFFPEERQVLNPARLERLIDKAKSICAACPVQHPCREEAYALREPYGIRGGETSDERRRNIRRRQREARAS